MKMLLKDGKANVLTFSYDDGRHPDKRLVDIFNQYGLKGTFKISSGLYASEGDTQNKYMPRSAAQALLKNSGHEVAVHGFKHQWPTRLTSVQLIQELLDDRQSIEDDYGTISRGMAYAYGDYNSAVLETVRQCGIVYARTTRSTHALNFPENWLEWHPTCHHNDPRLMEIAKRFVEEKHRHGYARLFYVWGHSFEFDRNDNWNVIEKFAQYIAGHDHIWYATNIEIYDYVSAYNRLQVSADEKIVHNPSAIDVWVNLDDQAYCIKAGQTINTKAL